MKETSFAYYVDDNMPYVTSGNLDKIIESLEEVSIKLFQCSQIIKWRQATTEVIL